MFLNAVSGGPCWAGLNVHLKVGSCRWRCFSGCASCRGRRTGVVTASGGPPPGPHSYQGVDWRGLRRSSDPSRWCHWADPPPPSETQSPISTSRQPITAQLTAQVWVLPCWCVAAGLWGRLSGHWARSVCPTELPPAPGTAGFLPTYDPHTSPAGGDTQTHQNTWRTWSLHGSPQQPTLTL